MGSTDLTNPLNSPLRSKTSTLTLHSSRSFMSSMCMPDSRRGFSLQAAELQRMFMGSRHSVTRSQKLRQEVGPRAEFTICFHLFSRYPAKQKKRSSFGRISPKLEQFEFSNLKHRFSLISLQSGLFL